MKNLIAVSLIFFLLPGFVEAQKKKEKQSTPPVDTTSSSTSSSGGEEMTLRFSSENLDTLGFGPQNYRNLHVRLSADLKGRQTKGDTHVDDEGRIVYKKRPDLSISSEDRGLITDWKPAGAPGWIDDRVQVSFTLKGEQAPFAVFWFVVREWGGDETTSLLPDSKEADNSLFYIKTAEGEYAFTSSAAEVCLLVDVVIESPDDPRESDTRKPSEEVTGGKKETNKWSNRGLSIADL